jgi:hypothetical protein
VTQPHTAPPGLGPPTPAAFGPFIGPSQVRDAVQTTVALWAPTYVAEAGRRVEQTLIGFDEWANDAGISPVGGDQAPRWSVYCPGTLGEPHRDGDGTFRVYWDVQVNVWLYGTDWQTTEDTLGWYLTALRMALMQHPSLGGFAEQLAWRGERYEPVQETSFHTWGRGVLLVAPEVDDVFNAYAGPSTVPADPTAAPGDPPIVQHFSTTTQYMP